MTSTTTTMDKKKSIVVTGSNGFLGRNLCEELETRSLNLIKMDKELDGIDLSTELGRKSLEEALSRPDVDSIVMMAASIGVDTFESNPLDAFRNNLAIDQNCIRAIERISKTHEKKFNLFYYSSSEAFGSLRDEKEFFNGFSSAVNFTTVNPRSLYACEKAMTETVINTLFKNNSSPFKTAMVFRPFNICGRWQRRGYMHKMVKTAIEHGEIHFAIDTTREVTPVDIATKASADKIDEQLEVGDSKVFNDRCMSMSLGSGVCYRMEDIAKAVNNILLASGAISKPAKLVPYEKDYFIQYRGTSQAGDDISFLVDFLKEHHIVDDLVLQNSQA